MAFIREMVRELTALLLLAAGAELLIPRGKLSNMVRLVMGLAMVAVIMQAIPSIQTILTEETDTLSFSDNVEEIEETSAQLTAALAAEAEETSGEDIVAVAESAALSAAGVTAATAKVTFTENGAIDQVTLCLQGNSTGIQAAGKAVQTELGITEEQIIIEVEEDSHGGRTGEENGS